MNVRRPLLTRCIDSKKESHLPSSVCGLLFPIAGVSYHDLLLGSSQTSSRCAALCFIPQWPLTIAILQQATPWGECALVGGCTAQCGHNDMSFLMTWRGGQASDRTRFWTQAYTRDGLWIHLCALQPGTPCQGKVQDRTAHEGSLLPVHIRPTARGWDRSCAAVAIRRDEADGGSCGSL